MSWYNPKSWFKEVEDITLVCDSLQCQKPIEGGPIIYSRDFHEIYHMGGCAVTGVAHQACRMFDLTSEVHGGLRQISLSRAKKLYRKNKLTQSQGLEDKV